MGGESIALRIINLGTRWAEWLASWLKFFTSEKINRYPLDKTPGGPQRRT